MLKLVRADDVPFDSVVNYCESFGDYRNYECEILEYADLSKDAYKSALRNLKKNNGYLFYLVNEEFPDYLIGVGYISNIRANYHSPIFDMGCLAGGVRPNERCKGYASELLLLMVNECKDLGLKEVCVSCYENNIASKKIIEKTGGILEKEFTYYGKIFLKYWVPTERKIDKIKCKTLNYKGKRKSNC